MRTPRLLISDDDALVAAALGRLFERRGFQVVLDTESRVAELARELRLDAILVDLFQRQDGLALLAQLKADPRSCTVPAVLMSGALFEASPADPIWFGARTLGAAAVVPKPLSEESVEELVALVRRSAATADADAAVPTAEAVELSWVEDGASLPESAEPELTWLTPAEALPAVVEEFELRWGDATGEQGMLAA